MNTMNNFHTSNLKEHHNSMRSTMTQFASKTVQGDTINPRSTFTNLNKFNNNCELSSDIKSYKSLKRKESGTQKKLDQASIIVFKKNKMRLLKTIKEKQRTKVDNKTSKIRLIRRKTRKRNFDGMNTLKAQKSSSPVKSIKELLQQTSSYSIINDRYEDIVNKINVFKQTARLLSNW